MERIADALDKPLTELLEETDLDSISLEAIAGGMLREIADGYECISLIPPRLIKPSLPGNGKSMPWSN